MDRNLQALRVALAKEEIILYEEWGCLFAYSINDAREKIQADKAYVEKIRAMDAGSMNRRLT